MDLKAIRWVEHMYKKCETLLSEVEGDIYQDVVNYVENQVQTVGDGVKKFYTDVIQYLLPPSSAAKDGGVPAETYVDACKKEVHVNVDDERAIPNHEAVNVEVENQSHEASCGKMAVIVSGCDEIEHGSKREYDVSVHDPSFDKSLLLRYIDNNMMKVKLSSCSSLPAESNGFERDLGTVHRVDRLKLEESCVLVNRDELRCVSLTKGKSRSRAYKEKIRDVLSLRTKSARKEEYKQLAALYAYKARSLKPDLTMEDLRSLPTNDVGESEWEFL